MYKRTRPYGTSIDENDSVEGETIEQKVERIVNNKEPITDGAPSIYTERKDGVMPGFNPRTDRFDVAIDAMDKVTRSHIAKREERLKAGEAKIIKLNEEKKGPNEGPGNTGGEPTQSTT